MDLKATVISGEAPESDDETVSITTGISYPSMRTPNTCGTIISGEAPESDDDRTSLSSVSGAIDAMVCPPYTEVKIPKSKKNCIKYNSLLHKKLRERNEALDNDILETYEGVTSASVEELTVINRQLLKSELILQEAACQLHHATNRVWDASNILFQLTDTNFFNSIKT